MSVHIEVVQAQDLTGDQLSAWEEIQQTVAGLDSPYFHPAFTRAVAAVRDGVEVAVCRQGGAPIAFFPYQRSMRSVGRPVGDPLSDFQAIIARAEWPCEPLELLRACRLSSWKFDHLVDSQPEFHRYAWQQAESPYVDLSAGFAAYAAGLKHRRKYLMVPERQGRALARDHGPVRFEHHVADPAVLDTLVAWKEQQYRRTRVPNVLGVSWRRQLLERLLQSTDEDFSALLSVLYVAERPVAINYSLRSRAVLHSWFPAYDRGFARYSPGVLLFIRLFQAAAELGIRRVDLGKGFGVHKHRYASGASIVLEGAVDTRATVATMRRLWYRTRQRVLASRLYPHLRAPARMVSDVLGRFGFRQA